MSWTNPLDKAPWVPVDYANHIIYGGMAGVLASLAVKPWTDAVGALTVGLVFVAFVAVAKKAVDFVKEGEALDVCVNKAAVTCAIPATMFFTHAAGL